VRRLRVDLDEFARSSPHTCRANSITAICMPKQMPKNGTPLSRAWRTAAILPSVPRGPKPSHQDGIGGRDRVRQALGFDLLGVDVGDLDPALVGDAAVHQRLVEALVGIGELDVLATIAIFTVSFGLRSAETMRFHLERLGEPVNVFRRSTMRSSSPSAWNTSGTRRCASRRAR